MTDTLPFISVIIPVYHDWDRLRLCIDALDCQTCPRECFEVVIINNDPEDRPDPLDFPENCVLITEARQGSYAARNTGITAARGEILAFTDADCIPCPEWLEQAVHILQGGANRVAGKVELFFQSDRLTWAETYEKAFAFDQRKNVQTGGAVTANMVTWKKNFETVGPFNSELLSGGDNEWGWRAQKKGIKVVYAPSAVVRHPARRTISELLKKQKRVIDGQMVIEGMKSGHERFVGLFADLLPPVVQFFRLIKQKKDLSVREKIVAGMVLTGLRVHRLYYRIRMLSAAKNTPVRR